MTGAPSTIITEADLAPGGTLLLSDDNNMQDTLSVAGSFGDQQFLTNVAGAASSTARPTSPSRRPASRPAAVSRRRAGG